MSRAGSIKKDASGRWAYAIDVAPPGAPRKQVFKRGFATKAAAQDGLDELRKAVRDGSYVEPTKITFGAYLTRWIEGLPAAGKRETTITSYRRLIEKYVAPFSIAEAPLQGVTAADLDALYSHLATKGRRNGSGLSLRTVRYTHAVISKALGDAERKGLVSRNVAKLSTPPATSATRAPEAAVWTPAELRTFLDATAGHHHGALIRVAAMTGMRRGELCGLRWSDVDLEGGVLVVRHTITAAEGDIIEGDVKTARSRRTIDLDAETVAVMRRHRKAQAEQRLLMGAGRVDRDLVFAMPDGGPWHPDVITRAFARLVKASGLSRIKLHGLRHTHATHLLASGVNAKVVSTRLGHASVSFTLDCYAHVMPGQQADAAAAVAALVDGR